MPKKGVLFLAKLYLLSHKIGVKISKNVLETTRKRGENSENVLETTRKRGAILSCGTIMRYAFYSKVTTPGTSPIALGAIVNIVNVRHPFMHIL